MAWQAIAAQAGGELAKMGTEFGLNFASAKMAQDFAEKMYKHRFQWMMGDMKKAGLNPMLAYREAGPGTPTASGGFAPVSAPNMGATARQAMLEMQSLQKLKADTAKSAAEAEIIQKQVPRAEMETEMWERAKVVFDRFMQWLDSGKPGELMGETAKSASMPAEVRALVDQVKEQFSGSTARAPAEMPAELGALKEMLDRAVERGASWLKENSPAWKLYQWLNKEEPPRGRLEEKRGGRWRRVEKE